MRSQLLNISEIRFLPSVFSFFIFHFSFSQSPGIDWQNNIGGGNNDHLYCVINTNDGGYLLVGDSYSNISGDKTENSLGNVDYWVVKVDSMGNIEWQNTMGGNGHDEPKSGIQCLDGGYLITGFSLSGISGDKGEAVIGGTEEDIWIVKLNAVGSIEWENTIGSNGADFGEDAVETADGYLIGATSWGEISGDKAYGTVGGEATGEWDNDYWLIKIDYLGNIIWQKVIGGLDGDYLEEIDPTSDGGFIIGGSSYSGIGGDKTESNFGDTDFNLWVLKLDVDGDIMWQNSINAFDIDLLRSIRQTSDDGYIIGVSTNSDHGLDKTENHWGGINHNDFWVIKLSPSGVIQWQNNIGAMDTEEMGDVIETFDGGYLVGGYSYGFMNSGDKTDHVGANDYWILKLDYAGNIVWQDAIGSFTSDYLKSIVQSPDGGYLLAGYTISGISYDHDEPNQGEYDYWIVKIFPDCNPEICNTLDDNCNGLVDDGVVETITISAGGPTTFCQGDSVLLNATYTGATVQWRKNGSDIPAATNSAYSATTKGNYTCTTSSDCGSATSSSIYVMVNKNPAASITAGGPTTFCAGGSVTLTEAPVAGCSYQWYKGAAALTGATTTTYIATTTGNYKCRVTKAATGCYKNSNTINVLVVCKEGGTPRNTIELFPNPANDILTVTGIYFSSNEKSETASLQILNQLGQMLYAEIVSGNETNIDISSLPAGIYYVQMNSNGILQSEKFIKQ